MEITNVIPMEKHHLEEVGRLASQLGYPNDPGQLLMRFNQLQSLPHHDLFVYMDAKVLGWIHLEEVADLIEETKVEVKALIVDENSRSKGIGKSLLKCARQWSKIRNRDIIYLNCNIARDRAHAFYKREGFTLSKTAHFFEQRI